MSETASMTDVPAPQAASPKREKRPQRKIPRRDVHGWVILDKPVGMTSTQAVGFIKHVFQCKKAGHAGTLDPLASGILPIALGEATKTVPFVMDGRKIYRFTVHFGIETDTDDTEGKTIATSDVRPSAEAIRAILPDFTGTIMQVPPKFSALKIDGERAYDLARDGEDVVLEARPIEVHRLDLVDMPDADHAVLEAECGKGTYVRSLARDIGRALGSCGHVSALRRTLVGPFDEEDTILVAELEEIRHKAAEAPAGADIMSELAGVMLPVETALDDIPALAVNQADAARLLRGQAVLLRGRDAPVFSGTVYVTRQGDLIALAEIECGELLPKRVFNLSGGLVAPRT